MGIVGMNGEWEVEEVREGEGFFIFKNSMVPRNPNSPCYYEGWGFKRGVVK
jgi:hypothetical protein